LSLPVRGLTALTKVAAVRGGFTRRRKTTCGIPRAAPGLLMGAGPSCSTPARGRPRAMAL